MNTITNNTESVKNSLKFEQVTKIFPHQRDESFNVAIVNNLNFEITSENAPLFLLGVSGSGKTTIFNLILGKLRCSAGRIIWNDQVIQKMNRNMFSNFLRQIGYIDQFPQRNLEFELNAFQNLELAVSLVEKLPKQKIKERIHNMLELLQIEDLLNERIRTWSGGELQRLSLAKTLIKRPNIILCDEPVSQLDTNTKNHIWSVILDYVHNSSAIAIIATHNRELKMSENIIELEKQGWTI